MKKIAEEGVLYEIEGILDRRVTKGVVEYLVKWLNFDDKDNSWVEARNMACPTLIDQFEQKNLPIPNLNPFDRGFIAECLEYAKVSNDRKNLLFLVRFTGKQIPEWVSNNVVRENIPQLLIEFYETRIEWFD